MTDKVNNMSPKQVNRSPSVAGSQNRAITLDGRQLAASLRQNLKRQVEAALISRGKRPGLGVLLVGEDPASVIYVRNKIRACEEVGIVSQSVTLPATATTDQVLTTVETLNQSSDIHGILVQMPLPQHVNARSVLQAIDPEKDADGLHPVNLGHLLAGDPGPRPCTPRGIMNILTHYQIPLQARRAVVIGRSQLVGWPITVLLTQANATVTLCHSKTANLDQICRQADILVVAVGQAGLVRGDWIKPGATVIDVGMNRVDGTLVGDVDHLEAKKTAGALTPVPGGVGPMTIAMLLQNTWEAFSRAEA